MRKLLLILLIALTSLPALAGKRASIKQFEQGLAAAKGKPDKEFARWVFGFPGLSSSSGLLSSGEFGPVLHTVLSDAQSGKLAWSHWEMLGATTMAVFRYSVSVGKSHYKVKVLIPGHGSPYQTKPAYHTGDWD